MNHLTQLTQGQNPIRIVVRLPYNRPEENHPDPPSVEWNAEKEDILWEVIARSRASDSSGADWQSLSAHLQVPLPYLLYRARLRYEQDLRRLQAVNGKLDKPNMPLRLASDELSPLSPKETKPDLLRRLSARGSSSISRLSGSIKGSSSSGTRDRFSALARESSIAQGKVSSSSTLTLRRPLSRVNVDTPRSPSDSESGSESDAEAQKAEDEERQWDEQDLLEKKLRDLQLAMTQESLGFVRDARRKGKGKEPQRGRDQPVSPRSPLRQSVHRRDFSASDSGSTAPTSPQGSVPSIHSPSTESISRSPMSRHISPAKKSSSPPAISPGNARGQSHMQFLPMVGRTQSKQGPKSSNHGSSASSFSDISETSVSASALESALLSNIRGAGSRL